MSKKVLIITYYFPPSGGPGVQRILKFVKHLREFRWEPVVLTVREGAFPDLDESLYRDIPVGVKIFRTAALNPFGIYAGLTGRDRGKSARVGLLRDKKQSRMEKFFQWIRANIFIPDARAGWYPYAVSEGKKIIRSQNIDAILTSGPPHSAHLIGLRLHNKTKLPWIADFRDPWTDISMFDQLPFIKSVRKAHHRLEHKVLSSATGITTVSPSWMKVLREKADNNFEVVFNGYDDDDFNTVSERDATDKTGEDTFTIAHVGNLYGSRNPRALWQAFRLLTQKTPVPRCRVILAGNVDTEIRDSVIGHGLNEFVEYIPYLPHDEAIKLMKKSPILLLVIERWKSAAGMITGKVYEYLAAKRPVLCIGPPEGDAGQLLKESGSGEIFGWNDADGIKKYLERKYEEWAGGITTVHPDDMVVKRYTRRNQTRILAEFMNTLTEIKPR